MSDLDKDEHVWKRGTIEPVMKAIARDGDRYLCERFDNGERGWFARSDLEDRGELNRRYAEEEAALKAEEERRRGKKRPAIYPA